MSEPTVTHSDQQPVNVVIAGAQYALRYTLLSIKRCHEALFEDYGKKVTIEDVLQDAEVNYTDIATLLWAGLLHAAPEMSRDLLMDSLTPGQLIKLQEPMLRAWALSHDEDPEAIVQQAKNMVAEAQAQAALQSPPTSPSAP